MPPLTSIVRGWVTEFRSSRTVLAQCTAVYNRTRSTVVGDLIDVADSGARRRKGLLGRARLASGEGLWIVPCEAVHTFFMRCDLDLIYLNRRGEVVKVQTGVHPWRFSICLRAHSVLEVAVGTISSSATDVGDRLEIVPPHQAAMS